MSILKTNQNQDVYNDLLSSMFGSSYSSSTPSSTTSTTNSSAASAHLFNTEKTKTSLLSTFTNGKSPSQSTTSKDTPAPYESKYDKMEGGRMSTKVIRTQLAKNEKAQNNKQKDDERERKRLQALLGERAKMKIKQQKSQIDSSDDDDSDNDGSRFGKSKTAMIKSITAVNSMTSDSFGKKMSTGDVLKQHQQLATQKQDDIKEKNKRRAAERKRGYLGKAQQRGNKTDSNGNGVDKGDGETVHHCNKKQKVMGGGENNQNEGKNHKKHEKTGGFQLVQLGGGLNKK